MPYRGDYYHRGDYRRGDPGLFGFLGVDSRATVARPCVDKGRFERWSKGRRRGNEDSAAFLRKGIVGDWERAFTPRVKDRFKELYGPLLIQLGYAGTSDW